MATENEQVSTNTGKKISDYTDYHKDEQGQTIADVSYFEESAVIPLSGKYAASDENPKTKSVKLSEVIGGGVTVADNGGIEFSGTDLQLEGISNAESGMVPEKVSNGIHWTTPFSLPTMTGKEGYALSVKNDSGTLKPYWEKNVTHVYTDDGIVHDYGSGGVHIAVNLIENGGLEFAEKPSGGNRGIKVKNPVPPPGDNSHRGEFLTVNNSDEVVWGTVSGLPDTTGHSEGEVLAIGNNGPDWSTPAHIPVIGFINLTPSYNYIILQNFLDGHTIGTPIPGDDDDDYSNFFNTYPADKEAIGWDSSWSDTNLVNTTAGSQLLYSEEGFDFSKYGLTAGQIPFGYISAESYSGGAYANITLPSEFTYETWFNSPTNYLDGSFVTFYTDDWTGLRIWLSDTSISILFDGADNDTIFSESLSLSAGQWHHFALSCDGTNMYVFMDGQLLGTIVIANVTGLAAFLASTMREIDIVRCDNDRGPGCVWLAQVALCEGCKWTDDYELPKEAY